MSDKQKRFEPSMGWLVAINQQQVALDRVAKELNMDSVVVGQALDKAGYSLEADPFGYMSDTWKVLEIEGRKLKSVPTIADVAESVSELDEEEME